MKSKFGNEAPSNAMIYNWFKEFIYLSDLHKCFENLLIHKSSTAEREYFKKQ